MLDIEHALVKAYNWSLYDIDRTDADSLLAFLFHRPGESVGGGNGKPKARLVACDQVDWL